MHACMLDTSLTPVLVFVTHPPPLPLRAKACGQGAAHADTASDHPGSRRQIQTSAGA